ncbi:MAG: hypothetical protein GY714_06270 [Desulfobacterales bacterium]|nr:hypothetical protein [Desulfobacterales bacterium]
MLVLIFKYCVPVFGILGFAHAFYRVFIEKMDAKKMGLVPKVLHMYGIADLMLSIGWLAVLIGLVIDAIWYRELAFLLTGMFLFDYLVSLPSFELMGDRLFKYWSSVGVIVFISYCVWL